MSARFQERHLQRLAIQAFLRHCRSPHLASAFASTTIATSGASGFRQPKFSAAFPLISVHADFKPRYLLLL
jgi:hypothetical protein